MKKAIFFLVVMIVSLVAASRPAAACYRLRWCTPTAPCKGTISYIESACAQQAVLRMWALGQYRTDVQGGQGCQSTAPSGASGCYQTVHVKMRPAPSEECYLAEIPTLTGVGCCGQPCPPPGTDCEEN